MVQFPAFGRRRARFLAVSFLLVLGAGLLVSAAVQIARRTAFSREILALRYSFGEEATGLPGAEQYREGVPMEEMDFPALWLTPDENRWHTEKYPVETYPLLDDLTYYRMEDGRKAAALVIPRGTQMPCLDEGLTRNPQFGYGFYSYPTDEAGWRYAAPFRIAGEEDLFAGAEASVLSQEEHPFYYVRLEDLQMVYDSRWQALEAAGYDFREEIYARNAAVKPVSPMEVKRFDRLHRVDFALSRAGVYLSKDLTARGWRGEDADRMGWAAAALAGAVFCLLKGKGRTRLLALLFAGLSAGAALSAGAGAAARWAEHRTLAAVFWENLYTGVNRLPRGYSGQYREGVPMEEMDFAAFDLGPDAFAPVGRPSAVHVFTLSADITYYRDHNGLKLPVKTIPAGTQLTIRSGDGYTFPYGYGFSSYPTYQAGWRYAAPFERETAFAAEFAEIIVLTQAETPFYYVRIEDLASAYTDYCRAAEEGWAEIPAGERARQVYRTVTYLDQGLLDTGCYLSDDYLMASVLPDDIRAVVWGMGCLLAALVLFVFAGKNA